MADAEPRHELVSRKDANDIGLRHYFTGLPCRHGHLSRRLTKSERCCDCDRVFKANRPQHREKKIAYLKQWRVLQKEAASTNSNISVKLKERRTASALWMRNWRSANKEKNLAREIKYREENREKLRERSRLAGAKNKEKYHAKATANTARWKKANPEKVRSYLRNSKASRRLAEGSHTGEDIKEIYRMQRGLCAYCKIKVGEKYHVDHIQPLARGGSNYRNNLQILCGTCNLQKMASDPLDYARKIGRLL